ncbi:MAG: hypothetical protein QXU73_03675 [Thermoplasmata archaeon]
MFAARSVTAVLLSVAVLAVAVSALMLPWYHVEQKALTVSSDKQFKLQGVRSVVIASSDSTQLERVSTAGYDDPPDFREVGDLMQLESAILFATIVVQIVFVLTCIAGARRAAILAGALSLLLLIVTWAVFYASIEEAVNSSEWARDWLDEPITGFIGSRETSLLGVTLYTSWGPLTGWVLLVVGSVAQAAAVVAVHRKTL